MSEINQSMSRVRTLLLSPRDQKPSIDLVFTHLAMEYQNFYNELANTNLPWSYNTTSVNVTSGQTDYLVPVATGRVLFVTAWPNDTNFGPISLEFADLADITSDFFLFSPLDFGWSRDFNEIFVVPFPFNVAFYRKDGDLYLRLAPFTYDLTRLDIVYSTGNWIDNLDVQNTAVLSEHHALPEVRAAINCLPGAEWSDSLEADMRKTNLLIGSLPQQEARYAKAFLYAKRSLTADYTSVRDGFGDGF